MDWISGRHDQASAGPSEPIGREPEIQQLRQFISPITQGAGEALLLAGDPGVGKTSLLDQAAAIAAGSGLRLPRATGSQFEAEISFAALHQLLHPCFAELPHLTPLHAQALNVALGLGEGSPPAQLLVASAVLALLQQTARSSHCCSSSTTCRGWTAPGPEPRRSQAVLVEARQAEQVRGGPYVAREQFPPGHRMRAEHDSPDSC